MMKQAILIAVVWLLATLAGIVAAEPSEPAPTDSVADTVAVESDSTSSAQLVVYYLHGNRRCMTCEKLEAYAAEAIHAAFAEELDDSSVVFQVVNFESDGNEHFVKDYQLYTQSLVLSRQIDGEESEWKNLERIWKLVGEKDDYIAYVQQEIRDFLAPDNR